MKKTVRQTASEAEKIEYLEKELARSKKNSQEYLDGWKRSKADFINMRKQYEAERAEFVEYAEENILIELLELMDIFDEALKTATDKGIMQLRKKLLSILNKRGVYIAEVSVGDIFDPQKHEALKGEGTIIKEIAQNGYVMHQKVIRPSRVIVSKNY